MADLCYYCGKEGETDEYGYDHNLIRITGIKANHAYDFEIKWVKVPRCKSCWRKHDRFWMAIFLPTFLVVIVSLFWSSLYEYNPEDILYSIVISVMVGIGASKFLSRLLFKRLFKIKPAFKVDDYPPIKQLLDLGYKKKPPKKVTEKDIAKDVE